MATSTCKSCGAQLLWAKTPEGKNMPLDAQSEKRVLLGERTGHAHVVSVYTPHWATCPNADQHRAPKSLTETPKSAAETHQRNPRAVSERQLNAIGAISRTLGWSSETLIQRCKDLYGIAPSELSMSDASAFIGELQREITGRAI